MNEGDLRAALHDEAARADVGTGSLGRIHQRLEPSPRPAVRTALFSSVAVFVAVAAVAAALFAFRDRGDELATISGRAQYPRRILGITQTGQPVVLDSRTGRRLSGYDASGYARGTQLAVAPDGRDFYWVEGEGNKGCHAHSIVRLPLVGGRPGTQIALEASEPAISPDGRYLAYYRCLPGDERPDELVLRKLATGSERLWRATASDFFGERLVFEADSRHLIIEMNRDQVGSAGRHRRLNSLYQFATDGSSGLPGVEFGVAPVALFGTQGPNGDYVGHYPNRFRPRDPDAVVVMRPLDAEKPSVFSAGREFSVPQELQSATSDPTGRRVLAIGGRTLYRWSRGDRRPTMIRDGVIAAAWIPDPPKVPTPAPPIVAVRTGVVDPGPTVVLDPETGAMRSEIMHNTTQPGYVAATSDGAEIVFSPATPTDCARDGGPGVQRVPVSGGPVTRIVSGSIAPVVNGHGLTAYGIVCDGPALGFTDLNTGLNYRADPLGDRHREASRRLASVEPLGWSPDGTRLLYRLRLSGDDRLHYYVGALFPAVPSKRTKVIELPDGAKVTAATFVDNHHVLVAEAGGQDTQLHTWRIDGRRTTASGDVVGRLPRGVTSLVADHSGVHILALADGKLFRWDRGDGSSASPVGDHFAAAAWLGTR